MQIYSDAITVKGKLVKIKKIFIDNMEILIIGKLIKVAKIKEEWDVDIEDPVALVKKLNLSGVKIDIFTFMQRLPESNPKFSYYMEWDNVAAIPVRNYDYWFNNQLHQNPRNKIRKAIKKGVMVKQVEFNDELVQGITEICNETPIRQGRPFGDYGKNFDTLKKEHSTFLDKATFAGAYFNNELIGFVKVVSAGKYMRTMGILSKLKHRDKAPTNLLIAKAVEICAEKKIPYLVYAKFAYGKLGSDTLQDFKRYLGFEHIILPRYYIPLTTMGKIAIKFNLQHGVVGILPIKAVRTLLTLRNWWYTKKSSL